MEGTVKWFKKDKGYGFIKGEDGEDYFVHYSAVPQGTFLRTDDKVSFEPADTDRGKQAQNVALLEKASERTDIDHSADDQEASEESAESEEAPEEENSEEATEEQAEETDDSEEEKSE